MIIGALIMSALMASSCNKSVVTPDPKVITKKVVKTTSTPVPGDYWGCWKEAFGAPVYDILLTDGVSIPHGFQFGTTCIPEQSIPVQNIGVFRNDSLTFDNGTYEYWCYVDGDTLTYGAYIVPIQPPTKFVK